jgi:hypothetical protein
MYLAVFIAVCIASISNARVCRRDKSSNIVMSLSIYSLRRISRHLWHWAYLPYLIPDEASLRVVEYFMNALLVIGIVLDVI